DDMLCLSVFLGLAVFEIAYFALRAEASFDLAFGRAVGRHAVEAERCEAEPRQLARDGPAVLAAELEFRTVGIHQRFYGRVRAVAGNRTGEFVRGLILVSLGADTNDSGDDLDMRFHEFPSPGPFESSAMTRPRAKYPWGIVVNEKLLCVNRQIVSQSRKSVLLWSQKYHSRVLRGYDCQLCGIK